MFISTEVIVAALINDPINDSLRRDGVFL